MNSKHLSCVLLFAVIIALFQGTMMLHQRKVAAEQSMKDASDRHLSARVKHTDALEGLNKKEVATAARRKYLDMWRGKLEMSGTDITAKNEFNRLLKRFPTLIQFSNTTAAPVENKDQTYVNRRMTSTAKLEGDAEKAIQLLDAIERDLTTARISSLEIRKGQRANDVELDLSVDFPLLATPGPAGTAPAPAAR